MSFNVLDPGFLTTVQDCGRHGYQYFGVPVSGAMDVLAFTAGNSLVGNPHNAGSLEFTLSGPELEVLDDTLIAVTGWGFSCLVDGYPMPSWTAVHIKRGSIVTLKKDDRGSWGYISISGGIQLPEMLGSRSTYLRGHFGGIEGRPLQGGDHLVSPIVDAQTLALSGNIIDPVQRPHYDQNPTLSVIPGPQYDYFTTNGIDTFLQSKYLLSMTSDRMGYRMEGPPIEHNKGADIVSDGMFAGAVQVPANGQPIVMMAEAATTGGYTKIAGLTTVSRCLLAQCQPGESQVEFRLVSVENAQQEYRAAFTALTHPLTPDDDDNLYFSSF